MKVLFIGGTGVISSACSQLAVERGIELYFFNRGQTWRPIPEGVQVLYGDIRNLAEAQEGVGGGKKMDLGARKGLGCSLKKSEHAETNNGLQSGQSIDWN